MNLNTVITGEIAAEILRLRNEEKLKYSVIAEKLGIKEGTIRVFFSRLKRDPSEKSPTLNSSILLHPNKFVEKYANSNKDVHKLAAAFKLYNEGLKLYWEARLLRQEYLQNEKIMPKVIECKIKEMEG